MAVCNLDDKLLQLSEHDFLTVRDFVSGIHVFGAIGSGKTSATAAAISRALLQYQAGGLALVAKPEEIDAWREHVKVTGRGNSLFIFDETECFNFIDYFLAKHGFDGIGSVIEAILVIIDASRRQETGAGKGDSFWRDASKQLMRHSITLLYAAHGTVTIESILDFIYAAPKSADHYRAENAAALHDNFAVQTMLLARDNPKIPIARETVESLCNYWGIQYVTAPEKTIENVKISLSTALDRFRHGKLRRIFSGRTSIIPDYCLNGGIILMAMPTLTWGDDGVIAQQLMKFCFQKMVEGRNALAPEFRERLLFQFADEFQYFIETKSDNLFLSTCRSARTAVICLSQNVMGYHAQAGKEGEAATEALLGKFNIHFFHANACVRSNRLAVDMIGRGIHQRRNSGVTIGKGFTAGMNTGSSVTSNTSFGGGSGPGGRTSNSSQGKGYGENLGDSRGKNRSESTNSGYTETLDNILESNYFSTALKTGGPSNNNQVSAIIFKNSGSFRANHGQSFLHVTFQQGRQ